MAKLVQTSEPLSWEHNPAVQEYLNTDSPNAKQCADAFYIRDVEGFNFSFEKVKQYSMNKLFTDSQTLIRNHVRFELNKSVNDYVKNTNMSELDIVTFTHSVSLESVREQIDTQRKRFIELDIITDHKEFYSAMTIGELSYLGW